MGVAFNMNEEMNFKINKFDNTNVNFKKKFIFRRTYFVLDDNLFVELLALMVESTRIHENLLEKYNETVATASKEIKFSDVSDSFSEKLISEQVINETFEMDKEQFDYLLENYKEDDLFLVNKETVDNLN